MIRTFCLLATLITFFASSYAQNTEIPLKVNKGRVWTDEGQKIKFTSLFSDADKYTYKIATSGQSNSIAAGNVVRIEQQTGTEAAKWGLVLGGAGFLGSLLGVLQAINSADLNGEEVDKSKVAPVVLGITAVSALIGVAIGSGRKKYKTVYSNPKYDTTAVLKPVRIGLACTSNQVVGVGLQFRF